jgi:hypothetical protein
MTKALNKTFITVPSVQMVYLPQEGKTPAGWINLAQIISITELEEGNIYITHTKGTTLLSGKQAQKVLNEIF